MVALCADPLRSSLHKSTGVIIEASLSLEGLHRSPAHRTDRSAEETPDAINQNPVFVKSSESMRVSRFRNPGAKPRPKRYRQSRPTKESFNRRTKGE